jgi:hypothetical protein
MFGTAWEMDNNKHKVPVREWFVRSWPALMPDVLTSRVPESSGTKFMHADLLTLHSGSGNSILVPDHVGFEEFPGRVACAPRRSLFHGWVTEIALGGGPPAHLTEKQNAATT